MLTFGEISGHWDQTVWLIGGGTSITGLDVSKLDGIKVGCNKSALHFGCDVLFSLDHHFPRKCRNQVIEFIAAGGEAYFAMPVNESRHEQIPGAVYVQKSRAPGLSKDARYIYGSNSGYGALNLAYMKGAKDIRLLGYDMQHGHDGQTHAHGGYHWGSCNTKKLLPKWATAFSDAQLKADGVKVINYIGEPRSLITAFETRPLTDLTQ